MNLADITPLLLTYDEAPNLPRALPALEWARQIVVIDSGSTDETEELARCDDRVRFIQRMFDSHASQWNFGLEQIATEWTLALDADYVCPPALGEEIRSLTPQHDAYAANFVYAIHGQPLRGTLYPPRMMLFRTRRFRYVQDGHTQQLDLQRATFGWLNSKIWHDDRKSLARWLQSQAAYAALEADKLLQTPARQLGWKDRLRRGVFWAPPLTLAYCLFWKRLLLDGWPGMYYSLQRTYAELVLSLELAERRLRGRKPAERAASAASAPDSDPMILEKTAT